MSWGPPQLPWTTCRGRGHGVAVGKVLLVAKVQSWSHRLRAALQGSALPRGPRCSAALCRASEAQGEFGFHTELESEAGEQCSLMDALKRQKHTQSDCDIEVVCFRKWLGSSGYSRTVAVFISCVRIMWEAHEEHRDSKCDRGWASSLYLLSIYPSIHHIYIYKFFNQLSKMVVSRMPKFENDRVRKQCSYLFFRGWIKYTWGNLSPGRISQ